LKMASLKIEELPIKALVDTGSTHCLIHDQWGRGNYSFDLPHCSCPEWLRGNLRSNPSDEPWHDNGNHSYPSVSNPWVQQC
jgi:hypothetical protein